MRSALDDLPVFKNEDLVRRCCAGKAVRNENRRLVAAETVKLGIYLLLGNRVKSGCRLVENENIGIRIERSRNR